MMMITEIDGSCYVALMHSGIKNLERYRSRLNELNVFPVPDGDTGTNMVMTLRAGYNSIKNQSGALSKIAGSFSSSAVFGARGNSGVIVSQFFKGMSEAFKDVEAADCTVFADALQSGCKYAYASVAEPVEGTILTVLKDASLAVTAALPLSSINEAVEIFLHEARISLANTPELLPILKKASVVDSGGSGIVCFFEGVEKYLKGESVEAEEEHASDSVQIDLSLFNKDTPFDYGYCVEGLMQLTVNEEDFDHPLFKSKLCMLGESVVSSLEGDKVKLHVHVKKPGAVMDLCQQYGELLTVKIENMSVQKLQKTASEPETQMFLYDPERTQSTYAVIAVATNPHMQKKFFEMGADVVILGEIAPSSKDFMDAFARSLAKEILVFPNSANSVLSATQAAGLYEGAQVRVLNCRSLAECHAALSIMDFDSSMEEAVTLANETISGIYQFSVYHAARDVTFGSRRIAKNDYFALSGSNLIDVCDTLEEAAVHTIDAVLQKREYDVITLFYGKGVTGDRVEALIEKLSELGYGAEYAAVPTFETVYDITVTFE